MATDRQAGEQGRRDRPGAAWSRDVVASVAAQVLRHRTDQSLKGEVLADRCTNLGYVMDKSTLSKLETGIRQTLGVGELMVLAAALGVPPISLLIPTGEVDHFPVTPKWDLPIDQARRWFDGHEGLNHEGHSGGTVEELERLRRARYHDGLTATLTRNQASKADDPAPVSEASHALEAAKERLETAIAAADEDDPIQAVTESAVDMARGEYVSAHDAYLRLVRIEESTRKIRALRRQMREAGDVPPPLTRSLAWIDDDEVSRDA